MNIKIVMEIRKKTPKTENLTILRNFQYGPKFLVSYEIIRVSYNPESSILHIKYLQHLLETI